ncbi:helix-turn-helix transcriptional regulator [Sulfurovum sp. CS9]|jgi:predicted DNA-binding transcriptional regulator AlpA|uniref:helix-turn-helix transcriptional regulator n=1 Tax=Sulfurovum sp. CS9 TaxID=3391146 RepID=UPI0039E8C9CF
MDKFLRLPQVAEMLGVSKSTVWLYAREGKLPKATKLSPRVSVWKESDVMALMEKASA